MMPPAPIAQLVYLHGFRSSPQSTKARQTAAWLQRQHPAVQWWCPQLPPSPAAAMQLLRQRLQGASAMATGVIGSSLGGYYATALAEWLGSRAVLLNPAVEPARDLAAHIGETTAWHSDERFYFRREFIDELRAIAPGALTAPERYFAIIAKGDEVLSWVEMSARYRACRITLLEGGDHALTGFERHLPEIAEFFGLAAS
jgi:predicted esterase YcpF (UPF0227 family)